MRQTMHVEDLLKLSQQGQNANDVYFTQLIGNAHTKKDYVPVFSYADGSTKASRIKGKKWDDTMFEMSVDVYDDDINFYKITTGYIQRPTGTFILYARRQQTKDRSKHPQPKSRRTEINGSSKGQRG